MAVVTVGDFVCLFLWGSFFVCLFFGDGVDDLFCVFFVVVCLGFGFFGVADLFVCFFRGGRVGGVQI